MGGSPRAEALLKKLPPLPNLHRLVVWENRQNIMNLQCVPFEVGSDVNAILRLLWMVAVHLCSRGTYMLGMIRLTREF